ALGAGRPVVERLVAQYRQLAGEAEAAQLVGRRHAGRPGTHDDDAVPPTQTHERACLVASRGALVRRLPSSPRSSVQAPPRRTPLMTAPRTSPSWSRRG